MFLRQIQV